MHTHVRSGISIWEKHVGKTSMNPYTGTDTDTDKDAATAAAAYALCAVVLNPREAKNVSWSKKMPEVRAEDFDEIAVRCLAEEFCVRSW